jgi:hypothetical protein
LTNAEIADDLQNGMLYEKQEKSDHRVVIPLRKEAKFIFSDQYKKKIPSLTTRNLTGILKQ